MSLTYLLLTADFRKFNNLYPVRIVKERFRRIVESNMSVLAPTHGNQISRIVPEKLFIVPTGLFDIIRAIWYRMKCSGIHMLNEVFLQKKRETCWVSWSQPKVFIHMEDPHFIPVDSVQFLQCVKKC